MAIHWQVKFKSLRAKELFTVNIYDADYTGSTPVQLKGGERPFVTQEDDDDDMFQPVRTQSGYLRIVDDGCDADGNSLGANWWRTFIPATDVSRPVTLTDSDDNVRWMGFMQAQNFGSKLYMNKQEREFPVQCPLSVLSKAEMLSANTNIKNFAYLLQDIITSIPEEARPTNYVFQGGTYAYYWLLNRIDWQNFVEISETNTFKAKYNYFELLEEICKYWGWTARVCRDTIFFTCMDDTTETTYFSLTETTLAQMASDTLGSITVEDMPSAVTIGNIFASENNDDYQMRGPNKAVVEADGNSFGTTLYQSFSDYVTEQMQQGTWYIEAIGNRYADYSEDVTFFEDEFLSATVGVYQASFNLVKYSEYNSLQKTDAKVFRIKSTYNGQWFICLQSRYEHAFNGFLTMQCDLYSGYQKLGQDSGYSMKMAIGIGSDPLNALWLNPYAGGVHQWENSVQILTATIAYDNILQFEGLYGSTTRINTNDCPRSGELIVLFYGSDDMPIIASQNNNRAFDVADFKINQYAVAYQYGFLIPDSKSKDANKYEAKNNNNVAEDMKIDTIFAGYNHNNEGSGLIVQRSSKAYFQFALYPQSVYERPEQYLVDRVVNYWATSKRKITCDLLTHDRTAATVAEGLTPFSKATIDGTTTTPLAIERDWCRDVVRLTLMEV